MASAAERYLAYAVRAIRERAYWAARVDWAAVEAGARERLEGAAARDAHNAVRYVLAALDDRHSFLRTPERWRALTGPERAGHRAGSLPSGARVDADVWRLTIPPTVGGDDADTAREYVAASHQIIREGDGLGVRAWIVDLTENRGGSVAQLLAAVGPLLGPLSDGGPVAGFVDRTGHAKFWEYDNGVVRNDDRVVLRFASAPSCVPMPRSAVLVDQRTASAAEAVASAFKGHPNARLFGTPTFGATTGNDQVDLPDGASLFVATGVLRNARGELFADRIEPDVLVDDPDASLRAAVGWLTHR